MQIQPAAINILIQGAKATHILIGALRSLYVKRLEVYLSVLVRRVCVELQKGDLQAQIAL